MRDRSYQPRQRGATCTIDRKVALNEYPAIAAKHSTSVRNTFTAAPFLDNHNGWPCAYFKQLYDLGETH